MAANAKPGITALQVGGIAGHLRDFQRAGDHPLEHAQSFALGTGKMLEFEQQRLIFEGGVRPADRLPITASARDD